MVDLADIANELRTQDNAITSDPLFIVYDKRRTYGMDSEFYDEYWWVNQDSGDEVDPDSVEGERMEGLNAECLPPGWEKLYYIEINRFIQAFFTRKAAEEYIKRNCHNMESPHVFVESLYGNEEMKVVRNALMEIPSVEGNTE